MLMGLPSASATTPLWTMSRLTFGTPHIDSPHPGLAFPMARSESIRWKTCHWADASPFQNPAASPGWIAGL